MTNTQKLYESYFAVYNDELRNTLVEESNLFEDIDYLYDDELEEIVDETIEAMMEEGIDLDDIEEAFEDLLVEATVTTGRGGYTKLSSDKRSAPVTTGQGTSMRQQARRTAVVSASRQRQAQAVKDAPGVAASRVKTAIKSGVAKARKAVDTAAGDYAAKNKLVSGKKGQSLNRTSIGMKQASKDPSVRRGIRSAVVGHLASRAANKLQRGVDKVKSAVTSAGQSAVEKTKSSSDSVQAKMQSAGSAAKKTGKGFFGKVARKVASGASKLASRLGEEVEGLDEINSSTYDTFDIVLEHLLDEGYADTNESALVIMANISDEWRESIVENRGMSYSGGKPGASGDGSRPKGITGGKTYQMPGWSDKDNKKQVKKA